MAASDDPQLLIALHELCADRTPVVLMSRDLLVVCHGRFIELDDDGLVLEFAQRPSGVGFSPPAFCIGSFVRDRRPRLFTTRIKRNASPESGGLARLQVEVPATIRWPESRQAVRVPVPPAAPLVVTLVRAAGTKHEARAIDLSLCGVLVELRGPEPPRLGPDERVWAELMLGDAHLRVRGIVRRRDPPRYGLYFSEAVREGRLDPPAGLKDLVDRLERLG